MRIFINILIRVSHDVLLEEDNVNFGLVIKGNYLLQSYIISPTMVEEDFFTNPCRAAMDRVKSVATNGKVQWPS
jgi:hypothetical protein